MGPHQEMAPRSVQCRFSPCSGNPPAQGRFGYTGGLDAIARMAGVRCACALPVAAAWRVGAQQGKRGGHGCSGAAAWSGAARWCWQHGHRALQRACACVLPQRHCARRGADSLSLHRHWSRSHPGKLANPQHGWPVAHLPGSAVHHRWRLPGGAQAASWRAAGGCAPSVASRWRRSSQRSRRRYGSSISSLFPETAGAREATTQISHRIAPHRPVRTVVSTRLIQPKKRVMSRPKPWPAERPRGCRKRELDLDGDPVRRRVQAAAGTQAEWTPFIDAVEEELVDTFLAGEEDAFRGRSKGQKLVWEACKQVSAWKL